MWIYLPIQLFINFFNSGFFSAFITFFVGFLAWIIYLRQKSDSKKDAANIILLEIKNAERFLNIARENIKKDFLAPDILLMPTESWSKYRYLFVRDLDRDEWDKITGFYNKCLLFDQAVIYNNSFFQKNEEQLRVNLQQVASDYAKSYVEENIKNDVSIRQENLENYSEKMKLYYECYKGNSFQNYSFYYPIKPISDAKLYLDSTETIISQTTIGTKLKSLAQLKD